MLTHKNETDWNQIDKNSTMFLKRMYCPKKKKKKNPAWTLRDWCCLWLKMTLGPKYLWTESNLRMICSLQGEPIPWCPFQLQQREILEKSNWFLICVAFLCFSKRSVYCDFPGNFYWIMYVEVDNMSSFRDLPN